MGARLMTGILTTLLAASAGAQESKRPPEPQGVEFEGETRLANIAQLTFGGQNAEAYWSPDGTELITLTSSPEWNHAGVTIWNIATGSPQLSIDGLDWWSFDGVTFVNDGEGFAVQNWDETQEPIDTVGEGWGPVQLRDSTTGQVLMSFAETEGQERHFPRR